MQNVRGTRSLSMTSLLTEVKESTRRISDLVAAVRSYSQLDRASVQQLDVTAVLMLANHLGLRTVAEGVPCEAHARHDEFEPVSRRLDRARPLWEVVICELGDGSWALAMRQHAAGYRDDLAEFVESRRPREVQVEPDRDGAEAEIAADSVDQIAAITFRKLLGPIAEQNEGRWTG